MNELKVLALSPGDMLPFSMVALLSFALGMIVTILFVMARSGSRTQALEPESLEEEKDESLNDNMEAAGNHQAEAPPQEIWERDPDWWKK